MKFDIIIKDASVEELVKIAENFTNNSDMKISEPIKVENNSDVKINGEEIEPEPLLVTDSEILPVTPTTIDPELDSQGLPWDGRIHSDAKTKTKDGTWRRRRNLDDAEYESVVNELKAAVSAPIDPVTAPTPVEAAVTTTPVATPTLVPTPMPVETPVAEQADPFEIPDFLNRVKKANEQAEANRVSVPQAMPTMPTPVATPMPPAPAVMLPPQPVQDLNTLITRVNTAFGAGKLQMNDLGTMVAAVNAKFGVQMAAVTDVAGRQDLIDAMFEELKVRGV